MNRPEELDYLLRALDEDARRVRADLEEAASAMGDGAMEARARAWDRAEMTLRHDAEVRVPRAMVLLGIPWRLEVEKRFRARSTADLIQAARFAARWTEDAVGAAARANPAAKLEEAQVRAILARAVVPFRILTELHDAVAARRRRGDLPPH